MLGGEQCEEKKGEEEHTEDEWVLFWIEGSGRHLGGKEWTLQILRGRAFWDGWVEKAGDEAGVQKWGGPCEEDKC